MRKKTPYATRLVQTFFNVRLLALCLLCSLWGVNPIVGNAGSDAGNHAEEPSLFMPIGLPDNESDDREKEVILALENEMLVVQLHPDVVFKSATYTVYNIFGKTVLTGRFAEQRFSIGLSGLQKGVYILVVATDSVRISRKFIKR